MLFFIVFICHHSLKASNMNEKSDSSKQLTNGRSVNISDDTSQNIKSWTLQKSSGIADVVIKHFNSCFLFYSSCKHALRCTTLEMQHHIILYWGQVRTAGRPVQYLTSLVPQPSLCNLCRMCFLFLFLIWASW